MSDTAGTGPLGVVLVGAGAIAQTWAQAFSATDEAKLLAVCDVRVDAAKALAEPFDAVATDDLTEALRVPGVEAAVVCTPPVTHRPLVEILAGEGRHVLCEKPLSTNLDDAMAMLRAGEESGIVLTMASKFRYMESMQQAKSMIGSGALGEPVLVTNAFVAKADMADRWNADPAISGGGVLIDNGTHSVDIVRYLLGPIAAVQGDVVDTVGAHEVDATARLLLRTASGASAVVNLSWKATNFANTFVEVVGTDGTLRVGFGRSRVRKAASPAWEDFGTPYDKVHAHSRQLDTFAAKIRGSGELLISEDDALASVACIDAAYRSLESGRWEDVRPVRKAARRDP